MLNKIAIQQKNGVPARNRERICGFWRVFPPMRGARNPAMQQAGQMPVMPFCSALEARRRPGFGDHPAYRESVEETGFDALSDRSGKQSDARPESANRIVGHVVERDGQDRARRSSPVPLILRRGVILPPRHGGVFARLPCRNTLAATSRSESARCQAASARGAGSRFGMGCEAEAGNTERSEATIASVRASRSWRWRSSSWRSR